MESTLIEDLEDINGSEIERKLWSAMKTKRLKRELLGLCGTARAVSEETLNEALKKIGIHEHPDITNAFDEWGYSGDETKCYAYGNGPSPPYGTFRDKSKWYTPTHYLVIKPMDLQGEKKYLVMAKTTEDAF